MNRWDRAVALVVRRRWPVLALALVATVAATVGAKGIPFASGVAEYLPGNVPEVRSWLEFSKRFDAFNALIVGLEEPEQPLTREGLEALKRVTTKLSEMKAAGVLMARSITNVDSIREGEDGALNNELLIPEVPRDAAGLAALAARIQGDPLVSGALISRDQMAYAVMVRADGRKDSADITRVIEEVVERERGPLRAHYFGAPFFSAAITKKIYAQLWWLAPLFGLLLLGVALVGVRRPAVVALVLFGAGLSLVWWLGLVRLFGIGLSQTSANAALVLLVLAAVAYARGVEARVAGRADDGNPFPFPVLAGLVAIGLACLALTKATVPYLAVFGATMAVGVLAIVLFGVLVFAPLACFLPVRSPAAEVPRRHFRTVVGLGVGLLLLAPLGLLGSGTKFLITPQTMFAEKDEIGESLAYFDRRFGGTDVIQLDFRGSLRDPSTAARLMRLTDLLEGSGGFGDVRSVTQVLGFLSRNFGGMSRVPTDSDSLNNLWFFLEGSPDVKNLVSDARDEAMVVLRIPARPGRPMAEILAVAQRAIEDSKKLGPEGARVRLAAQLAAAKVAVAPAALDEVVAAAAAPLGEADQAAVDERVATRLKAFLASADSPYQPTEEEWQAMAAALAGGPEGRRERVVAAVSKIEPLVTGGMVEDFAGTLLSREKDLRLGARCHVLAQKLFGRQAVSEPLQARVQGTLADLLDPHANAAAEVPVAVSGMPAVASTIEGELWDGLWKAIAVLLALGAALSWAFQSGHRKVVRALLEGALATALALTVARLSGLQVDAGSATLYLMPPMLAFLTSGWVGSAGQFSRRVPAALLLGLAVGGLTLLFTGVLPIMRVGTAMAVGLCAVALVSYVSGLFRTLEVPR